MLQANKAILACGGLACFALLATSGLLTGASCSAVCDELQWGYSFGEFDSYTFNSSLKTPKGIAYDPSGQDISPQLIDQITDQVELCLYQAFGETPGQSVSIDLSSIRQTYTCFNDSLHLPIDRQGFNVIIPSNWQLSCDKSQQVLATVAGGVGTVCDFGEVATADCLCHWRAGIKCPDTLITTPSFYLYPDVLIRHTLGCADPWASAQLANCASPLTQPLSDGSKALINDQ